MVWIWFISSIIIVGSYGITIALVSNSFGGGRRFANAFFCFSVNSRGFFGFSGFFVFGGFAGVFFSLLMAFSSPPSILSSSWMQEEWGLSLLVVSYLFPYHIVCCVFDIFSSSLLVVQKVISSLLSLLYLIDHNFVLCWSLGRAIEGRHRPHHVFTGFTLLPVQI